MSSITQFPFPSDTVPESQVVEWLTEVLYPDASIYMQVRLSADQMLRAHIAV